MLRLRRYLMHLEYKYTETHIGTLPPSTELLACINFLLYDNHRAQEFSKILQVFRKLHQ